MAIMNEATKKRVGQILTEKLEHPVTILLFTHENPITKEYVEISQELCQSLVEMSNGLISLRDVDLAKEPEEAKRYGVDRVPTFVLLDDQGEDTNFRIIGAPLGYEFSILLEDLIDVSQKQTRLTDATRQALQAIDQEVMIQVFSTPT